MSIICQNVAILTTATIRTIMTVYVSTVISQAIGRPTPVASVVATSSCTPYTSANLTTERCFTSSMTVTRLVAPPPSQIQIPMTITSQIYQTQFNTLLGTSCRTIPVSRPPSQPTPLPVDPATQPTPQPTTPRPTPQPTPDPQPGLTDITYTTEYITITGSRPPDIQTTNTRGTSSMSRSTVYAGDPTPDGGPSGTALALGSSSSKIPVAAIAGGAAGGVALILLLALLAYFLIFKKSPKGYERPVGDIPDINGQTGLYPQMQEQAGYYHPYEDELGYGQQHQGTTGSQSQYSDYAEPPGLNAQGLYTEGSQGTPFWQQNMASGAAVATLPPGAAAAVAVGRSSHTPSSGSPASHLLAAPLVGGSRQYQPPSQNPFLVPYRGYAEPVDG